MTTPRFHLGSTPSWGLLALACLLVSGCPSDDPETNSAAILDAATVDVTIPPPPDVPTAPDIDLDDVLGIDGIDGADLVDGTDGADGTDGDPDATTGVDIQPSDTSGGECEVDSDCEALLVNLNACEAAICEDGECLVDGQPIGTPCDDGNACTENDTCTIGGCSGSPLACPDDGICQISGCDPTSGECADLDTDGLTCDDGDPCTSGDFCVAGSCKGVQGECPGCETDEDCLAFDDGDKCNGVPTCQAGECLADPGTVPDCSILEGGPCSVATCLPELGACTLVDLDDGAPCESGGACTLGGFCAQGQCVGAVESCDDGNPCTKDVCNEDFGCVNQPQSGAPCDDGDPCTGGDTCNQGQCLGNALLDCDDNNPCTIDSCDLATGQCANTPTDGPCDDGDACTASDQCTGGTCTGTPVVCEEQACSVASCTPAGGCVYDPLDCDDGDDCTSDACNPQTGACESLPPGDPCGTDLDCSTPDPCSVGICNDCGVCELIFVQCNDNNPCTTDSCLTGVGCNFQPTVGPCDDGDACTLVDICLNGQCVGTDDQCGVGTIDNPAASCEAILDATPGAASGLYWVQLGSGSTQVYCDMTLAGGGWMRIGVATTTQPWCSLSQGFGTAASVATPGTTAALLPASDITGTVWPKRQLLVRLPQGDFLFASTLPTWTWAAIADGTINAGNVANYQVAGGTLGSTLVTLQSAPPAASFAGPALLGGFANGVLTPFLGVGATFTGSFEQSTACDALTNYSGFYAGQVLPPAVWNTAGSLWVR